MVPVLSPHAPPTAAITSAIREPLLSHGALLTTRPNSRRGLRALWVDIPVSLASFVLTMAPFTIGFLGMAFLCGFVVAIIGEMRSVVRPLWCISLTMP